MGVFEEDFAKDMKDPEFAYLFGRHERELEIIRLLEEDTISWSPNCSLPLDIEHCQFCAERVLLIEAIKGDTE